MPSKRDAKGLLDDTDVEQAQLRVGVHTTLPVSKRFKSLAQGFTGTLPTSELASGGSFSVLPPEIIPEVAAHLTSTQDLVHFSLANKNIHVMLLHALFKAEVALARSYSDDLESAIQNGHKLKDLARNLVQQHPHTRQLLQDVLPALQQALKPSEEAIQRGFNFLQTIIEERVRPIKTLTECPNLAQPALSIQEKHTLVLYMLSSAKSQPDATSFIYKVKTVVAQVKDIIEQTNQKLEEQFALVNGALETHAIVNMPLPQLPAYLLAQAPPVLLDQQAPPQQPNQAQAPAQEQAQDTAQDPVADLAQAADQLPAEQPDNHQV